MRARQGPERCVRDKFMQVFRVSGERWTMRMFAGGGLFGVDRSCGGILIKTAVFPCSFFFIIYINQQGLLIQNKLSYAQFFAMIFDEKNKHEFKFINILFILNLCTGCLRLASNCLEV